MIYVPDIENYECFIVKDKDTIRGYKNTPEIGQNIDYRDYFVNSHYIYQDGTELISSIPICLNNLTNEVYYRNDLDSILIIFIILSIVCFYFPLRLVLKMFKKR